VPADRGHRRWYRARAHARRAAARLGGGGRCRSDMPRELRPRCCVGYMEREAGRLQLRFVLRGDEHVDDIVVAEDDESVVVVATVCTSVSGEAGQEWEGPVARLPRAPARRADGDRRKLRGERAVQERLRAPACPRRRRCVQLAAVLAQARDEEEVVTAPPARHAAGHDDLAGSTATAVATTSWPGTPIRCMPSLLNERSSRPLRRSRTTTPVFWAVTPGAMVPATTILPPPSGAAGAAVDRPLTRRYGRPMGHWARA
jgi:hypothetical protein